MHLDLVWPVSYVAAPKCKLPDDATEEQIATRKLIEAMAIQFLWNWTGRRLGLTTITEILSLNDCRCGAPESTFWGRGPYPRYGGQRIGPGPTVPPWLTSAKCFCRSSEFTLRGPVQEILSVEIDGTPVTTGYWVENRRWLVRDTPWPTEGVVVTYIYGLPVPEGGQIAAGLLACEMAKAASNDRTCSLPQRMQTMTRQGITVGVLDNFDDVEKGRVGIWLVDSWVSSIIYPPSGFRVKSPDYSARQRKRVVTWILP